MAEQNIKLTIEYDGSAYAGWQIQDGQPTVQGTITDAIYKTTQQAITLHGAGRTDAGVHALGQVANFRIDHRLEAERYRDALNYYLPDDIRVKSSETAAPEFHARFSAQWRRYRYLLSHEISAVYRRQRWHYPHELDPTRLHRAAEIVLGQHDFAPFCVVASRKEDNACIVERSHWSSMGSLLIYEIRANRFLHNMVRALVGCMVNLATVNPDRNSLNLTLDRFEDIMNTPSDERLVFTAPAHGLYLVSVGYGRDTAA